MRYMDQQQLFEVEQYCLPGSTAILVSAVHRFGSIFMVWAWNCFFIHAVSFPQILSLLSSFYVSLAALLFDK